MSGFKDYTGQKFWLLTAEKFSRRKKTNTYWFYRCDCGTLKEVQVCHWRSGKTKSCGCSKNLKGKNHPGYKHGKTHTAEFRSWLGLRSRCYDKNNKRYDSYGGRGITVCDRWRDSFENFLADMGPKPTEKHSIDRIDVDGNYEPSNCRWATATIQGINQRKKRSNTSGITGVHWNNNYRKWIAQIRIYGEEKKIICASKEEAAAIRKKLEQERAAFHGLT